MNEKGFSLFFRVIRLLELVSLDNRFRFTFEWPGDKYNEKIFSIAMQFKDGNFEMKDYTNMYWIMDDGFQEQDVIRLFNDIEEYLTNLNKIINIDWISKYLSDQKEK